MSYDDDSTLNELKSRIGYLKQQRNEVMNELIGERKDMEAMHFEMSRMKKEKTHLDGLIREKMQASKEYDRIISESERTLAKLSQNTKKLLLSVDNQYGKYYSK